MLRRSLVLYVGLIFIGVQTAGLVGAFVGVAAANLISGIIAIQNLNLARLPIPPHPHSAL